MSPLLEPIDAAPAQESSQETLAERAARASRERRGRAGASSTDASLADRAAAASAARLAKSRDSAAISDRNAVESDVAEQSGTIPPAMPFKAQEPPVKPTATPRPTLRSRAVPTPTFDNVLEPAPAPASRSRAIAGQVEPGNINLTNRPHVKNADGSISTVRSISINEDGKEILIPTVSDDGKILSNDDAVALYKKTGKHLGKFSDAATATAYAQQLHEQQARAIAKPPAGAYDKNGHAVVDTARPDAEGHVPTHRLDQLSGKRPGESFEQYEDRVLAQTTFSPDTARRSDTSMLEPDVGQSVATLIAAAKAAGHVLTPAETRRSQERQEMLFQKGRSRPGSTVTWTLTSDHTPGRAVDFDGDDKALSWLQENAPKFGFSTLGAMDPGHVAKPAPAAGEPGPFADENARAFVQPKPIRLARSIAAADATRTGAPPSTGQSVAAAAGLDETSLAGRVANAMGEAAAHPIKTAAGVVMAPIEAAKLLMRASADLDAKNAVEQAGGDPASVPQTVAPKDAAIAAVQLGALALGPEFEALLGRVASPFIGTIAKTAGPAAAETAGKIAAIGARTATGAGIGATFTPQDPAVGAVLGGGLAGAHAAATDARTVPRLRVRGDDANLATHPDRLLGGPDAARAEAPPKTTVTARVAPNAAKPMAEADFEVSPLDEAKAKPEVPTVRTPEQQRFEEKAAETLLDALPNGGANGRAPRAESLADRATRLAEHRTEVEATPPTLTPAAAPSPTAEHATPTEPREYVPESSGLHVTEDQLHVRNVARGLKTADPNAIRHAAPEMATRIPEKAVLVPLPDSRGDTRANVALAQAIADRRGDATVADILTRSAQVQSSQLLRQKGKPGLTAEQHAESLSAKDGVDLPKDGPVVFIDNLETTGATAEGARRVLARPDAQLVTYAKAPIPAGEQLATTAEPEDSASSAAQKSEPTKLDAGAAEMAISSRADNPFRVKANASRSRFEQLIKPSAHDEGMTNAFPLGAGFGRKGAAKRIDRSVDRAVEAERLRRESQTLAVQADAFDRGEINAQGRRIDSASLARSEKRQAAETARDARIANAKDAIEGKERWQVLGPAWADALGYLAGGARTLVLREHREIVEKALSDGKPVPSEVLREAGLGESNAEPREDTKTDVKAEIARLRAENEQLRQRRATLAKDKSAKAPRERKADKPTAEGTAAGVGTAGGEDVPGRSARAARPRAEEDGGEVGSPATPVARPLAQPQASHADVAADLGQRPHVAGPVGHDSAVHFSDGSSIKVRYRAIESADLQPSHNPSSFARNPAYPEGIQGREYAGSRGIAARQHVETETGKLRAAPLLDLGGGTTDGPPVVTPHGLAIAGNQRAMMLHRAPTMAPDKYQAYRDALTTDAAKYGLDPAQIKGMRSPVLVREIADPTVNTNDVPTLSRLNQLSDTPPTKTKDLLSAAMGRATQMQTASGALAHFAETVGDDTIREYLSSASGTQFVRKLFEDGVFSPQERGAMVDANGAATETGKDAIEAALRVAAIGDPDIIHRAPAAILRKMESALPAIIRANATKTYALTHDIQSALELLARVDAMKADMQSRGEKTAMFGVADYLQQQDIFGTEVPPATMQFAVFLERTPKALVTSALREYADRAVSAVDASQSEDLFGEPPAGPRELRQRLVTPKKTGTGQTLYSISDPFTAAAKMLKEANDLRRRRKQGEAERPTTGIKNAVSAAERARLEMDERAAPEPRTQAEMYDAGKATAAADPMAIPRLLAELRDDPERIVGTKVEAGLLLKHRVDLDNRLKELIATKDAAVTGADVEAEHLARLQLTAHREAIKEFVQLAERTGTASARALAARRMMSALDYSLSNMEAMAEAAKGSSLTDAELSRIKALHDELTEKLAAAERDVAEARERAANAEADLHHAEMRLEVAGPLLDRITTRLDQAADGAMARIKARGLRAMAGMDPEDLADHAIVGAAELARGVRQFAAWSEAMVRKMGGSIRPHLEEVFDAAKQRLDAELSTEGKAADEGKKRTREPREAKPPADVREKIVRRLEHGIDDVGDLRPYLRQLALEHIRNGITGREDVLSALQDDLADAGLDVSRAEVRDALSGYGDFKPLDMASDKARLREIQAEAQKLAQLDALERGQAPLASGFERQPPSDEARRLAQQVNEAKKRAGIAQGDAAGRLKSALAAAKTRTRNAIKDLQTEIDTGRRIVRGKSVLIGDAELATLRDQLAGLRKIEAEVFKKPGLTDEQRLALALRLSHASVEQWAKRLEAARRGEFALPGQRPRASSPELDALRAKASAARREYEELKGLDPTQQQSKRETSNRAYRARLAQREAELLDRMGRADYSPKPLRPGTRLDAESLRRKAEVEGVKQRYQEQVRQFEKAQRTTLEKARDRWTAWVRAGALSWPTVIGKLTAVAASRMITTPLTDLAAIGVSKALPRLARGAPRYGSTAHVALRAEAAAQTAMWTQGMKDAGRRLLNRRPNLDLVHGKEKLPPVLWEYFGQLHGALKEPIKQAEYARSLYRRTEAAMLDGENAADPLVQLRLSNEAYLDAQAAISMNDSPLVSRYNRGLRSLEEKDKETGKRNPVLLLLATAMRTEMPIVKVPVNIVRETSEILGGWLVGPARAAWEYHKGIEDLEPIERDTIIRLIAKGSIGLAMLALGFFKAQQFGGYYQPGEKRGTNEAPAGGVRVAGHKVPASLLHNPFIWAAQFGATIRRVADSRIKKTSHEQRGIGTGVLAASVGLLREIPFAGEVLDLAKMLDPKRTGDELEKKAASLLVPGAVQWVAKQTDSSTVPRKPDGMVQHLKFNVPGLRETIPVTRKQRQAFMLDQRRRNRAHP